MPLDLVSMKGLHFLPLPSPFGTRLVIVPRADPFPAHRFGGQRFSNRIYFGTTLDPSVHSVNGTWSMVTMPSLSLERLHQ